MPLSLHRAKLTPDEPLWNLAVSARPERVQLEQARRGYLGREGELVDIRTEYTMHTAVGSDGRARDGFLYGLDRVSAGHTFLARIDADDEDLLARVARRLVGKVHSIGRGRSTGYGLTRIERIDPPPSWPTESAAADQILVWCVSDLALRDSLTGAPRLVPSGADFGLPAAEVDWGRSFLRTARWTPFNAYRERPDLERQVIMAGSVVVLHGSRLEPPPILAETESGVGEYRHEGLGRVVTQPQMLAAARLSLGAVTTDPEPARPSDPPDDTLGRWLRERKTIETDRRDARRISREWLDQMGKCRSVPAAQWGEIRRLAAMTRVAGRGKTGLLDALRKHMNEDPSDADHGAKSGSALGRGASAQRWATPYRGEPAGRRLLRLVEAAEDDAAVIATELLAVDMVRVLRQGERG